MGFNEKLAAAKAKPRPFKTVTVALDDDVAARLSEVEDQIEAEKQKPDDGRLAKSSPLTKLLKQADEIRAQFADSLVELKFERLIGEGWSDLTLNNPPRAGVLADMYFQYDWNAVTRHAAIDSGVVIEGDETHELTGEEWEDLFGVISGGDHRRIADAIFALNEGDSARAVEVGKALRAVALASEKKSS